MEQSSLAKSSDSLGAFGAIRLVGGAAQRFNVISIRLKGGTFASSLADVSGAKPDGGASSELAFMSCLRVQPISGLADLYRLSQL